jgi:sugar/nucleoside kinase (ribokinase family)
VPGFEADAVDPTGCGDAFSAGFLPGLGLGRDRREAAALVCSAAAMVSQGLGTHQGDDDIAAVEDLAG